MDGATGGRNALSSARDASALNLTPRSLISLDYLEPTPALRTLVTTFYHFRCDEAVIRDVQPAAVGNLIVFLCGHGRMVFGNGRVDPSHPVSLLTPCDEAAAIEVEGPFHCVGAALSPAGWAALTGLHARSCANRLLPGARVFGEAADRFGLELAEAYREGAAAADLCDRLAAFLLPRVRPLNPRHALLLKAVAQWLGASLDPAAEELYAAVPYSPRQTQRLVERYFGVTPRELKRKYRAIRVATLLNMPDASDADIAAATNLFCDQSHMIREIRHFVGRTPARLEEEGDTILSALLDIRNFRVVDPQVAPMPKGVFENDSQ